MSFGSLDMSENQILIIYDLYGRRHLNRVFLHFERFVSFSDHNLHDNKLICGFLCKNTILMASPM